MKETQFSVEADSKFCGLTMSIYLSYLTIVNYEWPVIIQKSATQFTLLPLLIHL